MLDIRIAILQCIEFGGNAQNLATNR